MVKLIMSDLDGTLVQEGMGDLPSELKETLEQIQEAGILFAVSSGRQYASLRRVFQVLDHKPLIVSLNGGCICRGDECIYLDPMPQQVALQIAKEAGELGWCDVILETKDQCWVYRNGSHVCEEQLDPRRYHYAKIDDLSQVEGQVVKVACYMPERLPEFLEEFQRRWGDVVTVARSGEFWVDFNVADKGKGLLAVCRMYGISAEETIAFGDNLNDEAMLAAAGTGYVVASGQPALKERFPICSSPMDLMKNILRNS